MKKINLSRRHIAIISSYLFLIVAFFMMGYFTGFRKNSSSPLYEVSSAITYAPYESAAPFVSTSAKYRVILEDGQLRLYADEAGISRLISAEEISETAYPVADIAALKKGLVFMSMDEAVSLIENFIS